MKRSSCTNRLNTARLIAVRELCATVRSPGIYIVMSISVVVAAALLRLYLSSISQNGLMVFAGPLNRPLYVSTAITATYLAFSSALSISRERDQGTLEVLFYGPVEAWGYMAGKYAEQMTVFLIISMWHFGYFYVVSSVTNLSMSSDFLLLLMMSVFVASCLVSFGVFISSLVKGARSSTVLFVGLAAFFFSFDLGYQMLDSLPDDTTSSMLIGARIAANWLNKVLEWISPFAYLRRGMDAVVIRSTASFGLSVLCSLVYTGVLLWLSVALLKLKGVRKQ